jgi:hypothetical protein
MRAAGRTAEFAGVLRLARMDDGKAIVAGVLAVDVADELYLEADHGRPAEEVNDGHDRASSIASAASLLDLNKPSEFLSMVSASKPVLPRGRMKPMQPPSTTS